MYLNLLNEMDETVNMLETAQASEEKHSTQWEDYMYEKVNSGRWHWYPESGDKRDIDSKEHFLFPWEKAAGGMMPGSIRFEIQNDHAKDSVNLKSNASR